MPDPIAIAIRTLNEALEADTQAIRNLFAIESPCNEALADHPTIQVGVSGNFTVVRILGLINGILENIALADGLRRRVAAEYSADRLIKFVEYDPALIEKESH